jgi:DNA-binding NtrC family response regulator
LSKAKVLLVDDEVVFGFALAERLRLKHYDVKVVSRVEDALAVVRNDPLDVVLLDFMMPGMDGIEILKFIKQIDSSIEVIMLTGHADTSIIEEVMKSGASEYIIKPADLGEVINKIDDAKKKRNSVK